MCVQTYRAHPFCQHPYTLTEPGDDWTQHGKIIRCNDAEVLKKHARLTGEPYLCESIPWVSEIDAVLPTFCASCEKTYAKNGDRLWPATRVYGDFEVKRDQWHYRGQLNDEEVEMINMDIRDALRQLEVEANRGPYNNSYWVLREALANYTRRWDEYVKTKLQTERQEADKRDWAQAWDLARTSNTIEDAMETSIYAPGFSAQAEASSSRSHSGGHHGSSSRSHHGSSSSSRSHKQSGWSRFFGGKK